MKPYREIFMADTTENIGDNWMIAEFGEDEDGKQHILTTSNVHASELHNYSDGAKADAELVAKLLNAYHNNQIKFKF